MWNNQIWRQSDCSHQQNRPPDQPTTYFPSTSTFHPMSFTSSRPSYHPYKRPERRDNHSSRSSYENTLLPASSSFFQGNHSERSDFSARPSQQYYKESWKNYDIPVEPVKVELFSTKSANECLIQWEKPALAPEQEKLHVIKIFQSGKLFNTVNIKPETCEYPIKTIPGEFYIVEYLIKDGSGKNTAEGMVKFRATFSKDEMCKLLKKAVDYVSVSSRTKMHPFRVLYRCKPQCYWDDIQVRTNNMMIKYIKDDNGQAANPTNGNIFGLFFSARLLPNGKLPLSSPFGNIRMMLPAKVLLDPTRVNMYFSDFYCNKLIHYVTIVICVKGTKSDEYCKEKIVPLGPSNPFVKVVSDENGYEFFVNKKVWVEIYFTENVPICWGKFDRITATGYGTSRLGGLPHNKDCQICNLYPIGGTNKKEPQDLYGDKVPQNEEGPYNDEEDVNEIVAKESLEKMISSMCESGLPRQDCEDIVFLVSDLVDQVACDTVVNNYVDETAAETTFRDTNQSERSFPKKNKGIASKLKDFRGSVSKRFDQFQSTFEKKKEQFKKKFRK